MRTNGHRTIEGETMRGIATRARVGPLLGVLLLGMGAWGCSGILGVEAAGQVDADDLNKPENASLLVSGTIADFDCASGAFIVNQGMLGNELRDASVTAARFSLDRRDHLVTDPYGTNPCTGSPPGLYTPLATARWSADNAVRLMDEWTDAQVPNRRRMTGQASAYGGYSLVLMGEAMCTTVIEDNGPELQPDAAFTAAVARFGRALEASAPLASAIDTTTRLMAFMGRARAQLNLGNAGAAAADAAAALALRSNFVIQSTASSASSRRWNRVGDEFFGGRITVDPSYRNLTVNGAPDPRVNVINTSPPAGHDGFSQVWLATKFGPARAAGLRNTPLPIATWREAHLIIAEAEGGQVAVDRINILRANAGLPLFASANAAEIRDQVIQERSRELFLEGHHLWDLRRFNLPFLPATGEPYRQGGVYGSARCFQLPAVERENNPNV